MAPYAERTCEETIHDPEASPNSQRTALSNSDLRMSFTLTDRPRPGADPPPVTRH